MGNLIKSLLVVDPEDRATLVAALDSEWLRRRDRESISKHRDKQFGGSSHSSVFDAWVKLQIESNHSKSKRPKSNRSERSDDSSGSICGEDSSGSMGREDS